MTYPAAFNVAFDRLIGNEGGYVNDPRDPGGETNWGISKRTYPNVDIKNLLRDEAKAIYFRDWWQKLCCDQLHPGVAYQVLDFAINTGAGPAKKALQHALGTVEDGIIGPATLAMAARVPAGPVMARMLAYRMRYYTGLPGWPTYGKGWSNRIAACLDFASVDV